ncbi:MAG: respiratory chain complex I subunit 1 family protein [Bacteroidota bacterium]
MNEWFAHLLIFFLQLLVMLFVAPLVSGFISKFKARLQSRRGAPFTQQYADVVKLFKKGVVVSEHTSWIFRATPYVVFGSTVTVALLVPTVFWRVPFNWAGDAITVIYLFALGRFFLGLVGLDAGSAFGGLGSSREMSIASIIEPAMMLGIFAAAVTAGSTNLSVIVSSLNTTTESMFHPSHILAFAGLFIAAIAETGRIPVDNPATHLELTMIHEAMVLEYSGRYLALIEWASQMKLLIFLAILANVFFPIGIATTLAPMPMVVGFVVFFGKVTVLASVIALIESTNAKLRLFRVPELLMVAFSLSLLSLILYFLIGA